MGRKKSSLESLVIELTSCMNSFWKDKKVLVTGHTGFKGAWLTLLLIEMGAKVFGFSLKDLSEYELFRNLLNDKNFHDHNSFFHFEGDINNMDILKKVVLDVNPDITFHLAAQPLVRRSYKEPLITWETNVLGTLKLLEALKTINKVSTLIVVTSDKVYENLELKNFFKESDRLGGNDPYSSSKAATEILISGWRKSFCGDASFQTKFLSIATARSGNVIGGGDWSEDRLVPDIVSSLKDNKIIKLRNPTSSRPWLHILETLNGYLLLAERLHISKNINSKDIYKLESSFNFGPKDNDVKTTQELLNECLKYWEGDWIKKKDKNNLKESNNLSLNSEKSKKYLNWSPKLSFETTVNLTINWYKKFYDKKSAYECCMDDINFYYQI